MKLQAVRGAVQIASNSAREITQGTQQMMQTLLEENQIEECRIVSVQFSITADLSAVNPATAFRQLGYEKAPLFCCQEPFIDGAMPRVVRSLVTVYVEEGVQLRPCYLNGAEKLRPDLAI
ncbi:MAG: chorismate mutase [Spirochaetota bacterium]